MTKDQVYELLDAVDPYNYVEVWNAAMEHAAKVAQQSAKGRMSTADQAGIASAVMTEAVFAIRAEKVDA